MYCRCICSNSNFEPIKLCFMSKMGFSWAGNSFLTIKITFENVLYTYWVYSGCIVGVSSGYSNFRAIELCLMANMGFSGMGTSFLIFRITFENALYCIRCIGGVFCVDQKLFQLLDIYISFKEPSGLNHKFICSFLQFLKPKYFWSKPLDSLTEIQIYRNEKIGSYL